MEPKALPGKAGHGYLKNFLVRLFLIGLLLLAARFAYEVVVAGEACNLGTFCFSSIRDNFKLVIPGSAVAGVGKIKDPNRVVSVSSPPHSSKDWIKAVQFYSTVFQDLVIDGNLSPSSKSLCVETPLGQDVYSLREIGVSDSIGVSVKSKSPLVVSYRREPLSPSLRLPFQNETFDFVFASGASLGKFRYPLQFASEVTRVLKPQGILVAHVAASDEYSFNSFLDLFKTCRMIKSRDRIGFDSSLPDIKEIVLRKGEDDSKLNSLSTTCPSPRHKLKLIESAEPLIMEEPLKPWLTLKRNIKNIKYLPSMADISFKNRYIYVDVGARSYGSSIGSWFKKQYPKQNMTFEIYAIEADKTFHKEYEMKKGVTLLPYAAWVRNETLSFEVNKDPGKDAKEKGRGMGRIQPAKSRLNGDVEEIQGFDFASWLKNTVTENDFVVLKMDVEGTEFDLIPRLFESGAICLIDEVFLECHYNRWQRCCPGERSSKYSTTYGQCVELFSSLRDSGVLVHQWW